MSLYKSKYKCNAALPLSSNPLPRFRDKEADFSVNVAEDISSIYKINLGKNCGRRIYPYNMQDDYSRNCTEDELDSIILENDILKATFLPTLGGRLISLYDKELDRELLYDSKHIQSCNLASRNAWFSGGIEFNVGQYGHSLLTMDNVFAASVADEDGDEFLRIGEYEKMHGVYYHIDFHLPPNSHFLYIKGEVTNLDDCSKSFYTWVNIALKQTKHTRVFSSTRNALFLNPFIDEQVHSYSKITLPTISDFKNMDASYPANFPFSNEYFFTCKENKVPYEATIETDGVGVVDFSTSSLNARKMFCWGVQNGGKRWQQYLNGNKENDYFEAQAGMAATQLHGEFIASNETKTFTQAIGSIITDSTFTQNSDYNLADNSMHDSIDELLNNLDIDEIGKKLDKKCNIKCTKILNEGSSFAKLNAQNLKYELPNSYDFLLSETNPNERVFESIIDLTYKYDLSHFDNYVFPPIGFYDALNVIDSPYTNYLRAMILIESFKEDEALQLLLDIISNATEHCLIYRAIAQIYFRKKDQLLCDKYYLQALNTCTKLNEFLAISGEYSSLLRSEELFEKEKELLTNIDALLKEKFGEIESGSIIEISDSIALDAAIIAAKYGDLDILEYCLFNRELSCIREGDNPFVYLYNEYKSLQVAKEKGVQVNDEIRNRVSKEYKLPLTLDFTMTITHGDN
jgi:hypothetical protein